MGRLESMSAVVTGSSSGIGKGIATRFAMEGANVVINSRDRDRAREAAEEIESMGGRAVPVEADTADRAAVFALVETAVDEFGRLDVMVNNAGRFSATPAIDLSPSEWNRVVDVNLSGVFFGSQAAGEVMINQGEGGQLINVSSIFGRVGVQGRAVYNATKGGVNNLTRCLAVEFAEYGIHVNALAPGFIRTADEHSSAGGADHRDSKDEGARGESTGHSTWPTYDLSEPGIHNRTPLGRHGTVEEIANCALFLASGDHYVTGEVLHADGGWLAFGWGSKGS